MRPDDLILTGSPGAGEGVDHASELGDPDHVWVAAAPQDGVADDPVGVHGPDPLGPAFGARQIATDPAPVDPVTVTGSPTSPVVVLRPDVLLSQHQAPYYTPGSRVFRQVVAIASGQGGP